MPSSPAAIFKALADDTRLRTLLLLLNEGELCVCEIACALDLSQPKVSRHLAQLRSCGLLLDSRHGQWIYYQLHTGLDAWISEVLTITANAQAEQLAQDQRRLAQMGNRPQRRAACC